MPALAFLPPRDHKGDPHADRDVHLSVTKAASPWPGLPLTHSTVQHEPRGTASADAEGRDEAMLDGESFNDEETIDDIRAAERKRRAAAGGAAPSPKRPRIDLREQARTALQQGGVVPYADARKDQLAALENKKSLNKNSAKNTNAKGKRLQDELKDLHRQVRAKNREIAENNKDKNKHKKEAAVLTREESRLTGRKINKEPLDGIYEDLVGPYELAAKIEQVFNVRKPNSPIYVGTAAGPGKAHAVSRKREHDAKWGKSGGIMRLIQVTEYAEAAQAEKAGIEALQQLAKLKKKSKDVQNKVAGGGGIHDNAPCHFVYIYYVPKKDPSA